MELPSLYSVLLNKRFVSNALTQVSNGIKSLKFCSQVEANQNDGFTMDNFLNNIKFIWCHENLFGNHQLNYCGI